MCTIIYVDKTASTNSLLTSSAAQFEHGTAIAAHEQTSGRGQRGNSWESEPTKNLTFSLLLRPKTILASTQFELSQLVSISIAKMLRKYLESDEVRIKWPNDIYYRDRKICGILIENFLTGVRIDQSVIGVGINVNQTSFLSDAPNPVSMANITGLHYDLDKLLEDVVKCIVEDFDNYEADPDPAALAAKYRFMLWRNEGFWPFYDNVYGQKFEARIAAVAPSGLLTLATRDGAFRTFAFKEVAFEL